MQSSRISFNKFKHFIHVILLEFHRISSRANAAMLRVSALSGHEVATFSAEDLPGSVKELKQRLSSLTNHSRFQQQLVMKGLELNDNDSLKDIDLPSELTFILRPFQRMPGNVELLSGIFRNDLCQIEEILRRPVDPDASDDAIDKNDTSTAPAAPTPLTMASELGFVDVVRILMEAGAGKSWSSERPRYREALRIACERGHCEVVQLLVDARANISDSEPLQVACRCGHEKVALLLIEAGAALGGVGDDEPFHWASVNSLEYVVRLLSNADLEKK